MNKDLEFLIELVKKASLLIDDHIEIKQKDCNGDLVTNLDYKIEQYIIDKIKENYPNFDIISEEYNSKNELTENCFTIDPIDGTINFVHGLPLWGIQVACIKQKKTCAAVIYLPKINELYYADESGAYLNGKIIKVNNNNAEQGLYTVAGSNDLQEKIRMKKINPHLRDFFCSSLDFAWVASGRLSGTILLKNSFWDYVPGQYIVEKAGGVIYNSDRIHIAANNMQFLEILKEKCSIDLNESTEINISDK